MLKLEDLKKLEKSELHAHLGSMVTPDKLWEIASSMGQKIPASNVFDFIGIINGKGEPDQIGHQAYLNKYDLTQRIQSSPIAIEQSVFNAIVNAYLSDNVTKIEIRFNPMLRNNAGFYNLDAIIGGACIGLIRAVSMYPVEAGIIISTDRSFTEAQHLILAEKAVKYSNNGVVGFDMSGGSPSGFRIESMLESFSHAKKNGLKTTIHTGEVPTIDLKEMEWVVSNINPDRIGHGILSHTNTDLLEMLKETKTHLEICPLSNIKTGCVKSVKEIKTIVKTFLDAGVSVSLNTDGTVFLNTSLSDQFLLVCDNMNEVETLLNNASKNSFVGNKKTKQ